MSVTPVPLSPTFWLSCFRPWWRSMWNWSRCWIRCLRTEVSGKSCTRKGCWSHLPPPALRAWWWPRQTVTNPRGQLLLQNDCSLKVQALHPIVPLSSDRQKVWRMSWEACLGFHLEVWPPGKGVTGRTEEEVGRGAHPRTLDFPWWTDWAETETGAGQGTAVDPGGPAHSDPREHGPVQASLELLHFVYGSFICYKATMPALASSPQCPSVPGCPKNPDLYSVEVFYFYPKAS